MRDRVVLGACQYSLQSGGNFGGFIRKGHTRLHASSTHVGRHGGGMLNRGLFLLCATSVPNVNRPCTTSIDGGPLLKRHRYERLRDPWFGESLGLQLVMVGSMASVQVPRNLDICTRLIAFASNASRKLTLFRTNWARRWVSGKPRLRSFQKSAVDLPLLDGGGRWLIRPGHLLRGLVPPHANISPVGRTWPGQEATID